MRNNVIRCIFAVTVVLALSIFISYPAGAKGMPGLSLNQFTRYLKYLPPIIRSVTQSPESPGKNDEVVVTARINGYRRSGDDDGGVKSATLRYTTDGVKWNNVEMESGDDDWTWTGTIPAAEACTEVDYNITVTDKTGNIVTELPGWLAFPGLPEKKPGGPAPDRHDYLKALSASNPAMNSTVSENMRMSDVPSYLSIDSVRFGFDAANLYFRIQLGSGALAGTLQPVDVNFYFLVLLNGSMLSGVDDVDEGGRMRRPGLYDMASTLWIWYYSPVVEAVPPVGGMQKVPGVGLLHVDPDDMDEPLFEAKGFSYNLHDKYMDVTIDRKFIGPSEGKALTFLAADMKAYGDQNNRIKMEVGDISSAVTVVMDDHGYFTCPEGEQ